MSLTPDVERRLHSVLDQGLDFIKNSEMQVPPHTSSMQSLLDQQYSSSLRQSSGTLEAILKPKGPCAPRADYETKTQALQGELETLQQKISALEAKLKTNPRISTGGDSPANSERDVEDRPLKPKLPSKPISKTTSPHREPPDEPQRTIRDLQRENDSLRQQLSRHGNLLAKLSEVQEEYNALAAAFEKSEKLRRKQKELIEKLRNELAKTSPVQTTVQPRRTVRARSAKGERSKPRSTSRKTVKFRK